MAKVRRATRREWWQLAVSDLRFAMRSAVREPWATGFIVLTLALGIGANAAIYGIAERVLLRGPAHVRDVGSIVQFYLSGFPNEFAWIGDPYGYVSYSDYELMRSGTQSFSEIAVVGGTIMTMGMGAEAQSLRTELATASLFPLLGVHPALGRFWRSDEDDPGSPPVAVLAYGTWRRLFGSDSSVIGRTLTLNGRSTYIIGVAPPGFTGPSLERHDLWMPVGAVLSAGSPDWRSWGSRTLQLIARVKPGVSLEQASADAQAVHLGARGLPRMYASARRSVAPLMSDGPGKMSRDAARAGWLAAVTIIVLVIACANVTNLLLARGVRRRQQVAVRLALGAGRRQLIRLFLAEAMVLALAGGVAALLVADVVGSALRTMLLDHVEWIESPLGGGTPLVIAGLVIVVGVAVGIVPALRGSTADLSEALKSGVRSTRRHSALRSALTTAQIALSVPLVVAAGLFVKSVWTVRTLDLGIDPERVLAVDVEWTGGPRSARTTEARQSDEIRRAQLLTRALDHIRRLRGVDRASIAVGTPLLSAISAQLTIPGRDSLPVPPGVGGPDATAVDADYFETVGTRIVRGRGFTSADDRAGSEPVLIVSELMASIVWPGTDPIGQCAITPLIPGAPCARIVGVASDTYRMGLQEQPSMRFYVPHGQVAPFATTQLLVRSSDPRALVQPVRSLLAGLDPTLALIRSETIHARVIDERTSTWRIGAIVLSMGGVLAVVVAAVGIFSVMSYLVAQRTSEIGVRVALGARSWQIAAMVARQCSIMAIVGTSIGFGIVFASGGLIEPMLFETSSRDPVVLGAAAAIVLLAVAAASIGPTTSALSVDPIEALRTE